MQPFVKWLEVKTTTKTDQILHLEKKMVLLTGRIETTSKNETTKKTRKRKHVVMTE